MYPTQICAYVFMHIFSILCASWRFHPGFFYAILQNAHRNRWMEMQLVTALKYETQIFHKFIRCLFDNSYISYLGLCICFIFCKALLDPVLHVIAMQIFDFKNCIMAVQLFLMILSSA